jgi:hypothetical protein
MWQLVRDRVGHSSVFGGDALEDATDIESVEIERARVALLGSEPRELLES